MLQYFKAACKYIYYIIVIYFLLVMSRVKGNDY